VLNLMPCVLPVLSVKALGLVQHSSGQRWPLRAHGLAYTAGVLASFAVVAGALIGLRAGGEQLGWGFQLQSPAFVTLLAWLFFMLALSFSGVIVVSGRLAGAGHRLAGHSGYAGSFATGALATVAATPCTAPFMGTAVGFAITQPWPPALFVFEALGLGLALPPLGAGARSPAPEAGAAGGVGWEPFSPERLAELRASGKPVFVNFTAAWCVTCLVNERVALRSSAVAEVFAKKGVVALKADW